MIGFDTCTNSGGVSDDNTPVTWNHTSSGDERFLKVFVSGACISGVLPTISGSYNGVALSAQGSQARGERFAWIGTLVAPASGSNIVSVTVDVDASGFDGGWSAFATTYTGVDQSDPIDAGWQTNFDSVGSTTPSVSVTTIKPNAWIIGGMQTQGNNGVPTANSPSILPANGTVVQPVFSFRAAVAYRGPESNPGAATLAWTITSGLWLTGAIAIRPSIPFPSFRVQPTRPRAFAPGLAR